MTLTDAQRQLLQGWIDADKARDKVRIGGPREP